MNDITVEILEGIRADLKEGLGGLRADIQELRTELRTEIQKTNERLDHTNRRLDDVKDVQDLLVIEHRKTNQRLDFFAEELVRMRTRDNDRISALEGAVAELQRKVG